MQAESFASGGNLATDASFGTATWMTFDAHSSVGVWPAWLSGSDKAQLLEHPNPERDGGQCIFVVRREDYVFLVSFVRTSTRSS